MLFVSEQISKEELTNIDNFFEEFEKTETNVSEDNELTEVSKYLSSLVSSCYKKSVKDIADTKIGNKLVRRRNFKQVMEESFFYGSNRFGNNFIA